MFRDRLVQYSRRRATISPVAVLDIRRGPTARVPEPTVLEDIRLRHRTGNRKDIAGHRTVRHTAAGATAALRTKAAEVIARPVTVHQATADALTAAVTAPRLRPADRRHLVAVVRVVALPAAAPADQVVVQAAPEDIANSQFEIKLLLSAPPLTGRLFLLCEGNPAVLIFFAPSR
jgi:hypothetical protein